jgi:hypothetical protein
VAWDSSAFSPQRLIAFVCFEEDDGFSLLLNSSWNYALRGLGFRPGFFEYLVPVFVFQGAYLCLLFS